ncbi:MAG: glycosyltransferase family protein, partial [Mobilitalea sp.]
MKEKIAFIVVNYKKYCEVSRLIKELKTIDSKYEMYIFVVDSGSGEEEERKLWYMLSEFEKCEIIISKENIGYSKGT